MQSDNANARDYGEPTHSRMLDPFGDLWWLYAPAPAQQVVLQAGGRFECRVSHDRRDDEAFAR